MNLRGIILNTFREAVRNKVFYLLVFLGILFALGSRIISLLTISDTVKVLKDSGLAAITFFAVLIAIFVGINLVYKEIEKKTIFNILSKPISRNQFIVGKFLGLALTLLVALAIMALIFLAFLLLQTGRIDLGILIYLGLLYLELLILTAISLLFSSFSTPILSSIFTISIFLIGHVTWTFNQFRDRLTQPLSKAVAHLFYYLLPNLEKFNVKDAVVMGQAIDGRHVLSCLLYALAYVLAILALAMVIFRRREFQ